MKKGRTPARLGWAWRMAGAWLAGGRANHPRTPDATAARPRADAITEEPQKERENPMNKEQRHETPKKICNYATCGNTNTHFRDTAKMGI